MLRCLPIKHYWQSGGGLVCSTSLSAVCLFLFAESVSIVQHVHFMLYHTRRTTVKHCISVIHVLTACPHCSTPQFTTTCFSQGGHSYLHCSQQRGRRLASGCHYNDPLHASVAGQHSMCPYCRLGTLTICPCGRLDMLTSCLCCRLGTLTMTSWRKRRWTSGLACSSVEAVHTLASGTTSACGRLQTKLELTS